MGHSGTPEVARQMQVAGSGQQVLVGATVHAWAVAATGALRRVAPRIDALNVFPVADGDTGTNMALTFAAGLAALERGRPASGADAVDVLARGAVAAARGSSGVILGAWLTGLADGLGARVEAGAPGPARREPGPVDLVGALSAAAAAATAAVERPSPGTVLDTAVQLADAARAEGLDKVLPGAFALAVAELEATSRRHPVLRDAQVVDAGACALLVVVEALAAVLAGDPVLALGEWVPVGSPHVHDEPAGGAFEVMGVLDPRADVTTVRGLLGCLGDALAVVGDRDGWRLHLHTDVPLEVLGALAGHRLVHAVLRAVHGPHQPAAVVVAADRRHAVWFATAGAAVVVPGAVVDAALGDVVHEVAGPGAVVLATAPALADATGALTDDPLTAAVACAAASASSPPAGPVVLAALARLRREKVADGAGLPAALARLLGERTEVLTAVPAAGADPSDLQALLDGQDLDVVLLAPGGPGIGWLLGVE